VAGGVEIDVIEYTVIAPLASVVVCGTVTTIGEGVVVIVIVVVGDCCGDVEVAVFIVVEVLGQLAYCVSLGLTTVMTLVMIRGTVTVETLPVDESTPQVLENQHENARQRLGKGDSQSRYGTRTLTIRLSLRGESGCGDDCCRGHRPKKGQSSSRITSHGVNRGGGQGIAASEVVPI